MATSVNWITGVITIPRADMPIVTVSPEIRELDIDALRLELRDLEENPDGRPWTRTHDHNTQITLSDTTYARSVIFLPPYTITFEDGQYTVKTFGANHNLIDVKNPNQVSVITENSAGLINFDAILEIASKTDLIEFDGGVVLDPLNGFDGTGIASNGFQIGTRRAACKNLVDTQSIAASKGLNKVYVAEMTLAVNIDLTSGLTYIGDSKSDLIIFSGTTDTGGCAFQNITLVGILLGPVTVSLCVLNTVTNASGNFYQSGFDTDFQASGPTTLVACYSVGDDLTIDVQSSNLAILDHHGAISFDNISSGVTTLEIAGGNVTINASCTGGTLIITGSPYEIIDNSTGTIVIDLTGDIKGRNTNIITTQDSDRIEDMWQFKGADAANPVVRSGDQVTESKLTVNGKVLTITPNDITRTP